MILPNLERLILRISLITADSINKSFLDKSKRVRRRAIITTLIQTSSVRGRIKT
jgi:hypothetical protein